MLPKTGEKGGSNAGKHFSPKTQKEAIAENSLVNNGKAKCVFCKETVGSGTKNKINIDHAEPRAKGGNSELQNANVTCQYCNKSKGTGYNPKNPKYVKRLDGAGAFGKNKVHSPN